MDIIASFYIGVSDYLVESEGHEETAKVNIIIDDFYKSATKMDSDFYESLDKSKLLATLLIDDQTFESTRFSIDAPIADDEEGLPVLFYVQAHFEISSELLSDFEEFDFPAILKIDNYTFEEALIESED